MTDIPGNGTKSPPEAPPPDDEGLVIEFVDHEDEGPHTVEDAPLASLAPVRSGGEEAPTPDQAELLKEAEERYLRLLADFENYRKRVERDREQVRQTACATLIRDILPALDDLDRARTHIPDGAPEEWGRGLDIVLQNLRAALGRSGLEEVDARGKPFDPSLHEACALDAGSSLPPNTVVDVFQMGYTLAGKLLRPSRVRVSAPAEAKGGSDA